MLAGHGSPALGVAEREHVRMPGAVTRDGAETGGPVGPGHLLHVLAQVGAVVDAPLQSPREAGQRLDRFGLQRLDGGQSAAAIAANRGSRLRLETSALLISSSVR